MAKSMVSRSVGVVASLAVAALLGGGCGGDDGPGRLDPSSGLGGGAGTPSASGGAAGVAPAAGAAGQAGGPGQAGAAGSAGATGSAGSAGATSTAGGAGAAGEGGQSPTPTNCGDIVCRGAGRCELDTYGVPRCVCDDGYRLDSPGGYECVVDETCVNVHVLREGCWYVVQGPPVVGVYFAVDYCAGTAVLPERIGDVSSAFIVREDGADIADNPESSATVIERDVESFVTLAIDVSGSILQDETLLPQLIAELQRFVASLASLESGGDPPVSVSILVFGRYVAEYVPFTTDLDVVDAALADMAADPAPVQALVGTNGTALFEVTEVGIWHTDRIQQLRELVTETGVLTSGTVVVVTDGNDSSGSVLDEELVASTNVNVISIGISTNIDDVELTRIGRDGSFLAPTPEDWTNAFDAVAQRVDEYPDRAYFLAYCSSATSGTHDVSVSLSAMPPRTVAACTFDASLFSSNPADVCDSTFFEDACSSFECGAHLACGACADGECCVNGQCQPPTRDDDCLGQDDLCTPIGYRCVQTGTNAYECQEPLAEGDSCMLTSDLCELGVSYCADDGSGAVCTAITLQTLPTNTNDGLCTDAEGVPHPEWCPELNCSKRNPDSAVDPFVCHPRARINDPCAGDAARAICERGSFCDPDTDRCVPRSLDTCEEDRDCLSGHCGTNGLCQNTGLCQMDWATVISP